MVYGITFALCHMVICCLIKSDLLPCPSPEILARIARNKQLALERLAAKKNAAQSIGMNRQTIRASFGAQFQLSRLPQYIP